MNLRYLSTIRPECQRLRKYLLEKYTKEHGGCHCSMCLLNIPAKLLDTAHLKPRYTLTSCEQNNQNNVEFMCKLCHSIYDNGLVGVNQLGILETSLTRDTYSRLPILDKIGHIYSKYCIINSVFLDWHYKYVVKSK